MNPPEYSIRYSSSTIGTGGNIVLPGGTSELRADGTGIRRTSASTVAGADDGGNDDDGGVVIAPDPSGIVIKTRLRKRDANHILLVRRTDEETNGNHAGETIHDAKVFLNICTHPMIATPGPRNGLDDEWRLPLSMSDLRPCRDKTGRAALAADCILNPTVVEEMHADAHRCQFVCDLVVQCATKKFGETWFGGLELDRRVTLPKMRYAGYVDERTGLPLMPEGVAGRDQRPVVAKQRVKRNGGKTPIMEEVVAASDRTTTSSTKSDGSGGKTLIEEVASNDSGVERRSETLLPKKEGSNPMKIELFIRTDGMGTVTLDEFLKSMAARESLVFSPHQPTKLLRDFLSSPKQKANIHGRLHDSQLLTTPIPFGITQHSMTKDSQLRNCCIIAKCDTKTSNPVPTEDLLPNVNASALLLEVSLGSNKTKCVLPFPVDTPRVSCQFSKVSGTLEATMPLLPKSVDAPDHGTPQWDLRHAFGDGNVQESNNDDAESTASSAKADIDVLDSYFVEGDDRDDESDDDRPLPEDAFHSRDALSCHLLEQQKKEMEERQATSKESREDADVEYIDVKDFQPGGKYFNSTKEAEVTEEVDESELTLKKAEDVMKQKLSGIGCGLAFSLV